MKSKLLRSTLVAAGLTVVAGGCSRDAVQPDFTGAGGTFAHHHEHLAPHGGTPVVLGEETFHLEFVRDADAGRLTAYVLDRELDSFIRIPAEELVLRVKLDDGSERLVLQAVGNPATGETVGDTSQFEGEAAWLRDVEEFDAVLELITVRGVTFHDVAFNFPRGNEGG